jgi:ribosomal protein L37AE/L43A
MLRGFESYGVVFAGKSGNQAYGNCPFCGKENKFYANTTNFLWDCKVCGKKGSFNTFLSEVYKKSLENMSEGFLKKLSIDRQLPLKALHPWKFGRYGSRYVLPVRNEKSFIHDLRTYVIGQKIKSTAGCNVGLLGIEKLILAPMDDPVYVCEGEWDGIALQWLLIFLKLKGVVVSVPGAQTFKREWGIFFQDRHVYCCYDHDEAGRKGELVAQDRLTGVAKSLSYLHWDIELPDGYDIRDVIVEKAIRQQKPRFTFNQLIKAKFKDTPRDVAKSQVPEVVITEKTPEPKRVLIKDVYAVFGKWLYIKNFGGIEVSLATIVSNELEGDPLWMFLVSSPGGSKTEILQSSNRCPNVYVMSTLTSHSLISGAHFHNGKDPSVLPELHQKTLVIKDFTPILTKKEVERDEIFGIFRDAYDGSITKVFGNGQRRTYICHFSILAGVTSRIHELAHEHQSLGERFLKYSLGDNIHHDYEVEMMNRAANNVGSETVMRKELSEVVFEFMAHQVWQTRQFKPSLPPEIQSKLIRLAQFGARMRGIVSRDRYRSDIMTSKPAAEYGTRLVKQLVKLMKSSALINGRKIIDSHDYEIAKKVMIDTIPQRIEDIVRCLHRNCPTINDTMKTKEVARETKYTIGTVSHVLADLDILGVVTKTGKQNIYEWTVSQYIRDLIKQAEIYT